MGVQSASYNVFMDGRSILNMLYRRTLDSMGILRTRVCTDIYVVVPGAHGMTLRRIALVVCFG
jgi:hypothetical protein